MKQIITLALLILLPFMGFSQRTEIEPINFRENISCTKTVTSSAYYIGDTNILSIISNTAQSTIPSILTYSSINIPNLNDGIFRKCMMTGDMTLYGPTNAAYGAIWTCYLTASNSNRNITFPATILIPSDSGFVSPKVLTANLTYIVQMRYGISLSKTNWVLNSVVGGY